nr:NBS-containing resistance-like protein [Tanacetum cinerariifolium]
MHDPREPHSSALKRILRLDVLPLGDRLLVTVHFLATTYSLGSLSVSRRFLLHTPLSFATLVYCDNLSAVYLSSNPVQHQRTKHIEIDIHFVIDSVASGQVHVLHVLLRY